MKEAFEHVTQKRGIKAKFNDNPTKKRLFAQSFHYGDQLLAFNQLSLSAFFSALSR